MGERIYLRKGGSGSGPKISVRQLQPAAKLAAPVSPMQRGQGAPKVMAGKEAGKWKLDRLGVVSLSVAGVSFLCFVISLVTRPDAEAEEQVVLLREEKADLARSFGKLEIEYAQLEQVRAKLERCLDSAQDEREELVALLKNNAASSKELPVKATTLENRGAQPNLPVGLPLLPPTSAVPPSSPRVAPEGPNQLRKDMLNWARTWTTLAFPARVTATKPFYLFARTDAQVKAPVQVGSPLLVVGLRGNQLVVTLRNSKTFASLVDLDATDYLNVITPRYEAHSEKLANRLGNTSRAAADHGASCVCATCRKNKNGGSLFPGL